MAATCGGMSRYYLKTENVNLSWVGTGRCLFSMDWKRKDYETLTANMLKACERMKADGWWDVPSSDVKKMVGGETARALIAVSLCIACCT